MKSRTLLIKMARITLVLYLAALTALAVAAVTIGPFKEPLQLATKIRLLESDLRENERHRRSLEEERARLLAAIKNLQTDWATQRETIRALRETVKNPEIEQRLVEANRLAEQLSQERSVLITKLNELRQEIQARDDRKRAEAEAELKKAPKESKGQ